MKQKTVSIEKELVFTFDPESEEFKRAYEGYKAIIDPTATIVIW